MISLQNTKEVVVIAPQSVGTTAVTGTVDARGANYLELKVFLAPAAATVTVAELSVSSGDATNAMTAIPEFTAGSGTGNFTAPTAPGVDGDTQVVAFKIDRRTYRHRYFKVSLKHGGLDEGEGRISTVVATLDRLENAPHTDAERGFTLAFS